MPIPYDTVAEARRIAADILGSSVDHLTTSELQDELTDEHRTVVRDMHAHGYLSSKGAAHLLGRAPDSRAE
jgi:hypothetical protein